MLRFFGTQVPVHKKVYAGYKDKHSRFKCVFLPPQKSPCGCSSQKKGSWVTFFSLRRKTKKSTPMMIHSSPLGVSDTVAVMQPLYFSALAGPEKAGAIDPGTRFSTAQQLRPSEPTIRNCPTVDCPNCSSAHPTWHRQAPHLGPGKRFSASSKVCNMQRPPHPPPLIAVFGNSGLPATFHPNTLEPATAKVPVKKAPGPPPPHNKKRWHRTCIPLRMPGCLRTAGMDLITSLAV